MGAANNMFVVCVGVSNAQNILKNTHNTSSLRRFAGTQQTITPRSVRVARIQIKKYVVRRPRRVRPRCAAMDHSRDSIPPMARGDQ